MDLSSKSRIHVTQASLHYQVVRYFDQENARYETNTDRDVLVLLDVQRYPELEQEGIAREVINRVQRLRKKAGLLPTDEINMYYRLTNDPEHELETVMKNQTAIMVKVIKKPVSDITEKKDGEEVFAEEPQEVRIMQSFDMT